MGTYYTMWVARDLNGALRLWDTDPVWARRYGCGGTRRPGSGSCRRGGFLRSNRARKYGADWRSTERTSRGRGMSAPAWIGSIVAVLGLAFAF